MERVNLAATVFKKLGDPNRIRILLLLEEGEQSVTEIVSQLGIEQSAVSHQLKILKDIHLVKSKRQGKLNIYSLDDHHVYEILQQMLEHVDEKLEEET